jgi:hypothetical protein
LRLQQTVDLVEKLGDLCAEVIDLLTDALQRLSPHIAVGIQPVREGLEPFVQLPVNVLQCLEVPFATKNFVRDNFTPEEVVHGRRQDG